MREAALDYSSGLQCVQQARTKNRRRLPEGCRHSMAGRCNSFREHCRAGTASDWSNSYDRIAAVDYGRRPCRRADMVRI